MWSLAALASGPTFADRAFRPSRKEAIVRALKGHAGDSGQRVLIPFCAAQNTKDRNTKSNIKGRFAWNTF
jgi:hypothetical protein